MNEHLHQTGRTSNMMAYAASLSALGFKVVILLANQNSVKYMQHKYEDLCRNFKITFSVLPEDDFNWAHMRPYAECGQSSNTKWLVDHSVIETYLEQDLEPGILRRQQLARQLHALTLGTYGGAVAPAPQAPQRYSFED